MFVVCDFCEKDYSDSDECGGFIFQSRSVCPRCAQNVESAAIKYQEDKYIVLRCATGQSFKEMVVDFRIQQLEKLKKGDNI